MKKVGRILFCFVPFLLTVGIQILISVPFIGIGTAYAICTADGSLSIYDLYNSLMNILTRSTFNTWLSATYGLSALIVFSFWYQKRFHAADVKRIRTFFNPVIVLAIVLITIGLQYFISYVANFTALLFPDWLKAYENLLNVVDMSHVTPVLAIYAVFIAPVAEEMTFRGVTLSYAKREMPFWAANILQSLLFGIFHMNPLQGVYAFVIGLFLGYVCHKGGSIFLSILLHALFNFWGTFVSENFMYGVNQPFFFVFWFVLSLVLLVVGFLLFHKGIAKRDQGVHKSEIPSDI